MQRIEEVQKEHEVKLDRLLEAQQQSKESSNTWKRSQFYEVNRVILYMVFYILILYHIGNDEKTVP